MENKKWIPGFLIPAAFHLATACAYIKARWQISPLERLALIYLATIIIIAGAITQYIQPHLLAIGIMFSGSFAIAVSIEGMLQSARLIIRLATSRE